MQPVPAVRARLRIRRGELDRAAAWAVEQRLDADDDLSYLREYEHLTLVRLLLAQHDERAAACSNASWPPPSTAGAPAPSSPCSCCWRWPGDRRRRRTRCAAPSRWPGRRVTSASSPTRARRWRPSSAAWPGRTTYVRRLRAAAARSARPTSGELLEPLSARELDVLRLLATDLDGPDIARRLHVSLNTLRTHSRNIFRKLDVTSRRAAVRRAAELD